MWRVLFWLMATCVFLVGVQYTYSHVHVASDLLPTEIKAEELHPHQADQAEAQRQATASSSATASVRGPLADYVARKNAEEMEGIEEKPKPPRKNVESDHVNEDSPVGTGGTIVNKTFSVSKAVNVAFEVPAHASSPQLHGTFHSYVQSGGTKLNDQTANIDFLVLNEAQYADLLQGHSGEAVFSAEDTHEQEVKFLMPSTFTKPAKYFLVFRNGSERAGKKVIQADFRVDF